jgi:hypothetical protein
MRFADELGMLKIHKRVLLIYPRVMVRYTLPKIEIFTK